MQEISRASKAKEMRGIIILDAGDNSFSCAGKML